MLPQFFSSIMKQVRKYFSFELFFCTTSLLGLAFIDPLETRFSFCPFHALGIYCPGCGLGRSISYLLHGKISASIHAHWLGMFALVIIIYRIFQLINHSLKLIHYGKSVHSS